MARVHGAEMKRRSSHELSGLGSLRGHRQVYLGNIKLDPSAPYFVQSRTLVSSSQPQPPDLSISYLLGNGAVGFGCLARAEVIASSLAAKSGYCFL